MLTIKTVLRTVVSPRPPRGRRRARADRPQQHDAGARPRRDRHGARPAARAALATPVRPPAERELRDLRAVAAARAGLRGQRRRDRARQGDLAGARRGSGPPSSPAGAGSSRSRAPGPRSRPPGARRTRHGRHPRRGERRGAWSAAWSSVTGASTSSSTTPAGSSWRRPRATSPNGFRSVVELNLNGTWNMTQGRRGGGLHPAGGRQGRQRHALARTPALRASCTRAPRAPASRT